MGKIKLKQFFVDKTGVTPNEAGIIIDVLIEGMTKGVLDDGKMTLPNFGTFNVKDAKGRIARNPRTGDAVSVPDRKVLRFKIAGKLKKLIAGA